jgi:uncharacterized protein
MKNEMIGRQKEAQILLEALHSNEPELVAIVGRRRIGKTFLVRTVYDAHLCFEVAGLQNSNTQKQLKNFYFQMENWLGKLPTEDIPTDWLTAFHILGQALDRLPATEGKKVLFFDEISWLDSRRSGFLEAFGNFWNTWASRRHFLVAICGSAASWIIQKIVHNRGGLHNRITQNIHLQPFTLAETETFLLSRGVKMERYHLLQLYMATGGVPHYLKEAKPGLSATQNIDRMFFGSGSTLKDEFLKLYPALFEHAENHMKLVRCLASKPNGITRKDIVETASMPDGGSLSRYLDELEQSGFISSYFPFGKARKQMVYRLTDEYSLFFLHFIENKRNLGNDIWHHLAQTPAYTTWAGYAFESLCLKHLPQIKQALGISGIYCEASAFVAKGNKTTKGVQIDLVIDRRDHVVNIFEMKFHATELALTAEDASALREKVQLFKTWSKTDKQVFLAIMTTFGMKKNAFSMVADHVFDMNLLFETG